MLSRETVQTQLTHTIGSSDIAGLGEKIEGKVRDCYVRGDKRILITSDRLSAFDVVLTTIPFKGQLLNDMAAHWFQKTEHIVKNHVIARPHPNVFVAKEVDVLQVEVVICGYLTGSAWRDYSAGKPVSGITLPAGLRKSERFETPLLTPSTKAARGEHDEPISSENVVSSGLVEEKLWEEVSRVAMELFQFGTTEAAKQGLILVDTKYEFGVIQNKDGSKELVLADEVHTQDSSRYWMSSSYQERFERGEDPEMLDKEFVRGALIERGYMGEGTPPVLEDDFRVDTALKYMEAFERITGAEFQAEAGAQEESIQAALKEFS